MCEFERANADLYLERLLKALFDWSFSKTGDFFFEAWKKII